MRKQQLLFSDPIVDAYMEMHQRVIELKLVYLTLVQLDSVSDVKKQSVKDSVEELSGTINTHFVGLLSKDINSFNIADFERQEKIFLGTIRKEIGTIKKNILSISPVKIKPDPGNIDEQRLDAMLGTVTVYDAPGLTKAHIDGLGRFGRYLLDYVYTDETPATKQAKTVTPVEKELLSMKIAVYQEAFQSANAANLDILYKMLKKYESLFASEAPVRVYGPVTLETDVDTPGNTIVIVYDDLYNVRLLYQTTTVLLEICIELADAVSSEGIRYKGQISGATTASGTSVAVFLADPAAAGISMNVDAYRKTYQQFLDKAELRTIYGACLGRITARQREHEDAAMRAQEAARRSVSTALDDLL